MWKKIQFAELKLTKWNENINKNYMSISFDCALFLVCRIQVYK